MAGIFNPENLFFRIMTKVCYGAALGLLWFFFSLPVVTAGASTAALNAVMLPLVRDEEGYVLRSFWQAFRKYFAKATAIWLVWVGLFLVLGFDILFFSRMGGFWGVICGGVLAMVMFVLALGLMVVFQDLVWFGGTWKQVMCHSLKMALGFLPYSLALLVLFGVMAYGIYVSVPLMFLFLFFGMGMFSYISAYLWRGVFERMERHTEASER